MFVVRDGHVLGPYRNDKNVAQQDSAAFLTSFLSDGVDGLFAAAAVAHGHDGSVGEEVEVEISSDGLRKARAVLHVRAQDSSAQAGVDGPWRISRTVAECDAKDLRQAWQERGLQGAQDVATAKISTATVPAVSPVQAALLAALKRATDGITEEELEWHRLRPDEHRLRFT